LRFEGKSGRYARRRVKFIRIFAPALIVKAQIANLKYDDLGLIDHCKALRFNGHIEAGGEVYLTHSA
jgi:hypothetical protein